jgi:hypothetical protein
VSAQESVDIGEEIERRVCERTGWSRLEDDRVDEPDAVDATGTPIEIKAAALEISDGTRTRSGRWYLRQRAHEELIERDGSYCLVVYELEDGGDLEDIEILSTTIVPARILESLIGSWSPVDRAGEGAVSMLAHSRVVSVTEGSA